jgi:hypothetical protein
MKGWKTEMDVVMESKVWPFEAQGICPSLISSPTSVALVPISLARVGVITHTRTQFIPPGGSNPKGQLLCNLPIHILKWILVS